MPKVYAKEHLEAMKNENPPLPWTFDVLEKLPFRGWIYARVEAPRKMPLSGLPPFLPYRTKCGNLVFPLCASCSEKRNQRRCKHNTNKRSWTGAFMHSDLEIALRFGYIVHEIYEVEIFTFLKKYKILKVWHWPKSQWTKQIFADYIKSALKLKVLFLKKKIKN